MEAFGRLLDVLDELREKCPWDRKQTNESLRPNTIEETYELCDALQRDDQHEICKELGDVLLHVCFYAKIGSERGEFDIADVCNKLCDKLIFRHPHVYGDVVAQTAGEVIGNWEKIKQRERDGNRTVLSGVPVALPSLIKAHRIQEKAQNVGFDWERPEDVWDKVDEELLELRAELQRWKEVREASKVASAESNVAESNAAESNVAESNVAESNAAESNAAESNVAESNVAESNVAESNVAESNVAESNVVGSNNVEINEGSDKASDGAKVGDASAEAKKAVKEAVTAEFGDFLFSLVNAARLYHINPDNALEHTNRKFITRFNYVEAKAKSMGKRLQDMTLSEMDSLWSEAKTEHH